MAHPSTSVNLAREWAKSQQNILAYIGSLTYNVREAEELLQETAANVFEHADRYDPARPFLPWALGIARNVVMKHRRQVARHQCVIDLEAMERLADIFDDLAPQREQLRDALNECREKLPPRSQQICRLRYESDLNMSEIAKRLGSTAGAIRVLLHRIRDQLRQCIEKQIETEGVGP
ncbi:MAG TPA: sigma-70 family RNA polymerase sigma factor [Planctomicrobium sp.]|nr:sigma-70 family RNA polymerase sigma factor [Planctomicrobium sp.]